MEQNLTTEDIAKIFALYFPNTECLTPDGRGIIVGLPHHIRQHESVSVHFGKMIHTKSSNDGGYNDVRNHGRYYIKSARYEPVGAIGHTNEGFDAPGGVQMILTPLSCITNEDAISVAKILSEQANRHANFSVVRESNRTDVWFALECIHIYHDNTILYNNGDSFINMGIVDFLRGKGYMVPYKGQDLFELGIAIDKTTLPK